MKTICDSEQCFGCCACYNCCPTSAISIKEDNWGNIIPNIDSNKCIDCGLCKKVCPAINNSEFRKPKYAYAAISKDDETYTTATSGGIATTMSKFIINENGVVYGAAFVNNTAELRHIRVDSIEGLEKLKGSKYVQSNIGLSFKQIKKDLDNNKEVLFIGTPCQVDGLIKFLNKDYQNLVTVNLICHGVPANRLLVEHLKYILKTDNCFQNLSFRNNNEYILEVKTKNKKEYKNVFYNDLFFLGFMRKMFFRNSCYNCKYAQPNRVGDITIGDFWGFDNTKPFPVVAKNGLSVILLNTDKGVNFFSRVDKDLIFQKRSIEEAIKVNAQLNHPSTKSHKFNIFRKLYLKYGFEKAAKKTLIIYKYVYKLLFTLQNLKN